MNFLLQTNEIKLPEISFSQEFRGHEKGNSFRVKIAGFQNFKRESRRIPGHP